MDFLNSIPFPIRHCSTIYPGQLVRYCLKKLFIAVIVILFIIRVWSYNRPLQVFRSRNQEEFRQIIFLLVISLFPPMIAIIIFVESFIKRQELKQFPIRIALIDSIIRRQLCIDMRSNEEKRLVYLRFFGWISITLVPFVSMVFMTTYYNMIGLLSKWESYKFALALLVAMIVCVVLILPPFIVMDLHFYRIVTYIDMVRYRYRLINECLREFHTFSASDSIDKHEEIRAFLNSNEPFNKLRKIRRLYRVLFMTNRGINDLFGGSLLVCIFFYFNCFYLVGYLLVVYEDIKDISMVSMTIFSSLNHVISLATICQLTSDEVRFIDSIRFEISFIESGVNICRQPRLDQICTTLIRFHTKDDSLD